jgi:hypothetical protein
MERWLGDSSKPLVNIANETTYGAMAVWKNRRVSCENCRPQPLLSMFTGRRVLRCAWTTKRRL